MALMEKVLGKAGTTLEAPAEVARAKVVGAAVLAALAASAGGALWVGACDGGDCGDMCGGDAGKRREASAKFRSAVKSSVALAIAALLTFVPALRAVTPQSVSATSQNDARMGRCVVSFYCFTSPSLLSFLFLPSPQHPHHFLLFSSQ